MGNEAQAIESARGMLSGTGCKTRARCVEGWRVRWRGTCFLVTHVHDRTRSVSRWSRRNPLARGVFSLSVALLALFRARAALASGISVQAFGAEHGTPMTTNATAVFYNPAGIGNSVGAHIYGDVS